MTREEMLERVLELRAWAKSRIEQCRRDEAKFCATEVRQRVKTRRGPAQAAVEAWTERRALETVLCILDGKVRP